MKSPHHLNVSLVQILKQQMVIQVMVVDVMQLHHIRLDLLYVLNKLFSGPPGAQPFIISDSLLSIMEILIPTTTNLNQM